MVLRKRKVSVHLLLAEVVYLLLLSFSFYLLLMSRAAEARTVWEVMHPLFIPTFLAATFVLSTILLTSEKTTYKLLFVIIHSILLHSFFSIIFPAGDASGQQLDLGRIRFAFDSDTPSQTWTPEATTSFQSLIYQLFRGTNFQAALSTILARFFAVDVFWVHLFLVPVLWGFFVPIAAYLATVVLGGNEKAAVLSCLLVSVFPYTIYFGAISVPTSLGFIFFFYSLYFMLKYLSLGKSKDIWWAAALSFFSFLSHYLTGLVSFSLLLLAIAFKTYLSERRQGSATSKVSLIVAFLISASLMPLSFINLRFVDPVINPVFTLDKIFELPLVEIIGQFFLGELIYGFAPATILLIAIGPLLAFIYMISRLHHLRRNPDEEFRARLLFLLAAFLMMFVDYRILTLFMSGVPINAERLWVFRDLISALFLALAIFDVVSFFKNKFDIALPSSISVALLKALGKKKILRLSGLLLIVGVLIPLILGGWVLASLRVAYPQFSPYFQVTSYEFEAVRYVKDNTNEDYVVIGDVWTVYAGEMVVGIFNPRAYYFGEFDKRRQDLFTRMLNETTPQVMIEAMNQIGATTNLAYFIASKARLIPEEYNRVIQQAQLNGIQTYKVYYSSEGDEKLVILYYKKQ